VYKKVYDDKSVENQALRDHPMFSMVPKEEVDWGESFNYFVRYGNPQGIGAVFSTAQTNAASSKGLQFTVQEKLKYGVITLGGPDLAKARKKGKGAIMSLVTLETDAIIEGLGDTLAFDLYRNGDGVRGRRSSASTNVITLTAADDARNFFVGMTVVADDTITGASLRTGSTTVTKVDEDAGTITLTSAAAITAFANNDYLFRQSDVNDACVGGWEDVIPLTAPSAGESWRGQDRSAHTRLLSGCRIDDTSTPIEENIGKIATNCRSTSKKSPDVCFLNPTKFHEVCRRTNAKVTYDGGGVKAAIGFESFDVYTPAGTIRCISDPDCPTNRGRVTKLDTVAYGYLDAVVHMIRDDSLVSLREASSDGLEARARSMTNFWSRRPGCSGVFSI